MTDHIEYFCFAPANLEKALSDSTMPEEAKRIVKTFLYSAVAEQNKLFHTNEHLGAANG